MQQPVQSFCFNHNRMVIAWWSNQCWAWSLFLWWQGPQVLPDIAGHSHNFCATLASEHLADRTEAFVPRLVFAFLSVACRELTCTKETRTQVWNLHIGTSSTSLHAMSCVDVVHSKGPPMIQTQLATKGKRKEKY